MRSSFLTDSQLWRFNVDVTKGHGEHWPSGTLTACPFTAYHKLRRLGPQSLTMRRELAVRHYFAAWTDSGFLLGCPHEHETIPQAVACIACAGGYVIGVENGVLRAMTDSEEKEFREAMYGYVDKKAKRTLLTKPFCWEPGM